MAYGFIIKIHYSKERVPYAKKCNKHRQKGGASRGETFQKWGALKLKILSKKGVHQPKSFARSPLLKLTPLLSKRTHFSFTLFYFTLLSTLNVLDTLSYPKVQSEERGSSWKNRRPVNSGRRAVKKFVRQMSPPASKKKREFIEEKLKGVCKSSLVRVSKTISYLFSCSTSSAQFERT